MTVGPSTDSWTARRERSVARGVAVTHPIAIARAEGSRVWDEDGHEYLDFASGISTLNIGHRHPRVSTPCAASSIG